MGEGKRLSREPLFNKMYSFQRGDLVSTPDWQGCQPGGLPPAMHILWQSSVFRGSLGTQRRASLSSFPFKSLHNLVDNGWVD